MLLHPHLHCVVTAGGLSSDEREWKPTRPGFFAPVAVLSKLFRGKFLAALQTLGAKGAIRYPRSEPELCEATRWKAFVDGLYDKKWVVYSKPPFGGAEHVFRYLGRYTHRVAISNYRLVSVAGGKVAFRYRDYARGSRDRTMTLDAVEFLRRFLLHVLPRGFVRIRHYGLYAPSNVGTKLAIAARLLGKEAIDEVSPEESDHRSWWERLRDRSGVDVMACPCCGSGRLVRSEIIARADHADGARASPEAG